MAGERLSVGAVQMAPVLNDLDANLEVHLSYVERAREAGVELLVFPELSLTGYDIGADGYRIALPSEGAMLMRIADAAGPMAVVVGFVEEGYAAQFFNAAAVVKDGGTIFVHRKLVLANYGPLAEGKYFASGRYVDTFRVTPPFVGSVLLCADVWNPALVHLAALHGATVLVAPTNSATGTVSADFLVPETWNVVTRFYSMIYGLPIVMANRVGTEQQLSFWGGSRIVGTHGEVLAEADGEEETLLVADLDYDAIREARYRLPTVRDSNLSLLHREVERLMGRVGVPTGVRDL